MKKIKILLIITTFLVNIVSFTSCNEDEMLSETPLDFYAPENSYITSNHFQMAVNNLYFYLRYSYWAANSDVMNTRYYATDFAYNATNYLPGQLGKLNDYTNVLVANSALPIGMWQMQYYMIKDANVIIDRLDNPKCEVPEATKKVFKSEALFFRAMSYRVLAHLYGGVPLVIHEATSPQRDLTRATQEDVYKQCVSDLEYAVENLSDIDKVKDGKVSKQVCQHLLSEIYISLKQYDKAIEVATSVIDYPAMALMTDRFGSRKTEPGDVYWDLFRLNNQNRSSGNKEALFVLQYDHLNAGSTYSCNTGVMIVPWYGTLSQGGKNLFVGYTDAKGEGIGWIRPTNFFFYTIWGTDGQNDIRNSQYNIVRDVKVDNPASPHYGKWLVKDGINKMAGVDTVRKWYPIITKSFRVSNLSDEILQKNTDGTVKTTAFGEKLVVNKYSRAFKDEYLFRLAETYLLRAEAYIGKSDKAKAADDINKLRLRAHATPIIADQATIDYVLDERLRELYTEEWRSITLSRLGKLVERNRNYNPYTGITISDHHNLWPIPYSEIERNILGKIEQNPGYSN